MLNINLPEMQIKKKMFNLTLLNIQIDISFETAFYSTAQLSVRTYFIYRISYVVLIILCYYNIKYYFNYLYSDDDKIVDFIHSINY